VDDCPIESVLSKLHYTGSEHFYRTRFLILARTRDVGVLNLRCEQTRVRLPGIRYDLQVEYMVPDRGWKL
jgi:hypothetical protein